MFGLTFYEVTPLYNNEFVGPPRLELGTSASKADVLTNYTAWPNIIFVGTMGIEPISSVSETDVINEKAGIDYGDYVLRGVADCAVQALMPGQDVYRVVSDEFMIVDNNGGTEQDAGALYRRIRNLIDTFIRNNNYESVFTVSGGIIIGEDMEGMSYNDIMKISQFALNEAKLRGKNQAYCFSAEDYTAFLRRHSILEDMRKSISLGFEGFDVYFQPIIRVGSPTLYAAESLMRYKTSEGEMISPVEFIPILEESGLIIPVGRWVLGRGW